MWTMQAWASPNGDYHGMNHSTHMHINLYLSTFFQVCKDCSNPMWYIPLLTTLFCGLVIVIFVVVFNLGVFPTLDSMLFFVQVSLLT